MKRCPLCQKTFDDNVECCDVCDMELYEVRPEYEYLTNNAQNGTVSGDKNDLISCVDYVRQTFSAKKFKIKVKIMFFVLIALGVLNIFVTATVFQAIPIDGFILIALAFWWNKSPDIFCCFAAFFYSFFSLTLNLIFMDNFLGFLTVFVAAIMLCIVITATLKHGDDEDKKQEDKPMEQ